MSTIISTFDVLGDQDEAVNNGFTSVTEGSGNTLEFASLAKKRGAGGMRMLTPGTNEGFVTKINLLTFGGAGSSLFLGWWFKAIQEPSSGNTAILQVLDNGGTESFRAYLHNNKTLVGVGTRDAGGSRSSQATAALTLSEWYWVVLEMKRASADLAEDGDVRVWLNGTQSGAPSTLPDNFNLCDDNPHDINVGAVLTTKGGNQWYYDDLVWSTSYPTPPTDGGGSTGTGVGTQKILGHVL